MSRNFKTKYESLGSMGIRGAGLCYLMLMIVVWPGADTFAQSRSPRSAKAKTDELSIQKAPHGEESYESEQFGIVTVRLHPGDDLRQRIEELVKTRHISAGFILTAVGSLRSAAIRLADQKEATTFAGKFEIVSLVGTMGPDGVHLHISIADNAGKTIGGHLVDGCVIYTTAEIVIGDARGLVFSRIQDEETGYKELRVRRSRR
jgi:predicted DNA-binding protein with PD1-like motif